MKLRKKLMIMIMLNILLEINKLTSENFPSRLAQANLASKNDIANLTFDSNLFIGQSYFDNYGAQFHLILQPLYYTLKRPGDTEKFVS